MGGKLVYSTKTGDMRKKDPARRQRKHSLPPAQQTIKLMRDRKGRKGKVVTVATGFELNEPDLNELAKTLKTMCGAGGTTKIDGETQVIEIQGDHRDKIAERLTAMEYKVKLAGG